jgi:hypothetical protein
VYFAETDLVERGRAIQIEYIQNGARQDMDIYGYAVRAVPADPAALEAS